ncbi:transcriptional enhancer factor TEF-5 [Trichinella spiralis]|uniref:transcriptional enhancer factor TEF-5 n=1 Tax=Trichinella spiralis TaxID=6334 RepID=UPI0001EFD93E|nr:transcriptional enhancer factor TEF-5 [Trichinella spiralis]
MDKKRPTLLLLSTTRLSFCDLCSAAAAAAATDDRYNGKRGRRRWVASTCFFRSPTAPMSITRQRQLRNRMTFSWQNDKRAVKNSTLNKSYRARWRGKAEVKPQTFADYKSHRYLSFCESYRFIATRWQKRQQILLIFKAPLCHSLANKLLLTDANACANEVSAVAPAAAAAAGSAAINCDERAWKRNGQQSVVTCAYVHQKREE